MTDLNLKELGRAVSEEFPETTLSELLVEQESFLNAVEDVQRPNRSLRYGLMAAAAVFLIGTLVYVQQNLWSGAGATLDQSPLAIGHQVLKKENGQEVIQFDGGSRFTLDDGTEAKVINSSQKEVVVALESGTVHCSVNGNGRTRWIVRAGDHQVLVTGTKFDVHWNPVSPQLEVNVAEGSVLITGAALNAHGIRLAAGENMVMDGNDVSMSDSSTDRGKDTRDTAVEVPEVVDPPPVMPEPEIVEQPTPRKSPGTKASDGKQKEEKLTYEDLWKIGSKARYQGDYETAFAHFLALQNRFAGKPYSKQATFLLGRICQEQKNAPQEAKKWFEQYLRISPSGALAEQSVGRLIQICRNAGQPCAREYAAWYQRHYPSGAFAELAQSVLE